MKKILSILMYLISAFFIATGFYKIMFYENPSSEFKDSINSYVGGDAYNYIINSNYATGYFVLALLFTIVGSTFLILDSLDNKTIKNK